MIQPESSIQQACFSWIAFKAAKDWRYKLIYAIPNGGYRHKLVAAKLKREGVKAGVWDIAIDVPSRGFHGARVEIKTSKGKLTKEQEDMRLLYLQAGYLPVIIRSTDQFINFIQEYFNES